MRMLVVVVVVVVVLAVVVYVHIILDGRTGAATARRLIVVIKIK